jgi:hypothetical protein
VNRHKTARPRSSDCESPARLVSFIPNIRTLY